jgi:hypothetical protein
MIASLVSAILPGVTDIISRFLPEDKEARAKAEREIEKQLSTHLAAIDIAQLEVNKEEAKSRNIFIAGWRPFVGVDMWPCTVLDLYFTADSSICFSTNG